MSSEDQYDTKEKAKNYQKFKTNPSHDLIISYSIKKLLKFNLNGKRCIDFACGNGYSTKILADLNPAELYGVDLSIEMIKTAQEWSKSNNEYSNIKFFVKDCSLPLNLGEFDVVFSSHLLNYCENEYKMTSFISSMYTNLTNGGLCIGIMVNPFQEAKNFSKLHKYGLDHTRNNNIDTFRLYDGDVKENKFLIEIKNYHWDANVFEECFKKCGFKNFEWIFPIINENYVDENGFYQDFLNYPPNIIFKAIK